jgi:Phage QLRG family, putative DNA packaging.
MLERIKLLLNISDESKDALLGELIDNATEFARNFINNDAALENLTGTIVNMVLYDYNRMGTEGLTSENYSGVSFGYASGYSDDIMKQLKRYRKVRVI